MSYLRNVWYVAGHAHELADTPLARTCLDEPLVMYRANGAAVAMDDRCAHRFAPLSQGKVIGDAIQCPYHGLLFDRGGACVGVPGGGDAPPRARQKTYPIVERHSMLWIWMGDSHLADPATIPDFSDRDEKTTAWFTGTLHCQANYQLLIDNLLDLTHAHFLHPFLTSSGWAERNRQEVGWDGPMMTLVNTAENDNILPVMAHFKPSLAPIGTTIQTERWEAPSLVRLSVEYFSGDDSITLPSAHMLTPETQRTTHYFIRGGQTVDVDNAELTQGMAAGVLAVFRNEDIPLIEAQQRFLGDDDVMDRRPAILKADMGAVQVRRYLARRIREEQLGATGASPAAAAAAE